MRAVKESAYAKINLYIDVVGKREDGFHEIKTVMHTVSLCDEITVTLNSFGTSNVHVMLDGNRRLPTDSRNLAVSAANLFLTRAGINADITLKLNKKIPIAAGLAGGSTDAAATLRALNKLFKRPFADRALLSMAEELGSDVPFCLLGGTAICEGRGEVINRLTSRLNLHTVIAVAEEHVSTPFAYSLLDEEYKDFKTEHTSGDIEGVLSAVESGVLDKAELHNIFESVILPKFTGAAVIKKKLFDMGATHALMSGSGPSVFGIFKTESEARHAAEALAKANVTAFYASSAI